MPRKRSGLCASLGALAVACGFAALPAAAEETGLLFRLSADKGLTADYAAGDPVPNFADKVRITPKARLGAGALEADDDQVLAWNAGQNIYAKRGTVSFFWRSRHPMGETQFPLFRVSYADHSSWDMVWLRIDWNGHGFDAFVTDPSLSRARVSYRLPEIPAADAWTHIAFSWDETSGVRLWVNGKPAARKDGPIVLDAGLDQFGPHSRIISPYQVQSRYNFLRGGDLDELRIYDRPLGDGEVASLATGETPTAAPALSPFSDPAIRAAWRTRFGWTGSPPPALGAASTTIRKVEFADAKDIKQWMYKGVDGIAETTWPGVYNRSRLEGRNDYFQLPDWNTYVEGGKAYDLTLPDEPWNRLEITGAAYGQLTFDGKPLARRPKGMARSTIELNDVRRAGALRFVNDAQETPIQEIAAYQVAPGEAPEGVERLSYTIRTLVEPDYGNLDSVKRFIADRHAPEERTTVVAVPDRAPMRSRKASPAKGLPIVHVLIPSNFGEAPAGQPLSRTWEYGWENAYDGLDGVILEIPALKVAPTHNGLFPLNIQVKDPVWPARNLIDVNVSVKPGEARTLWLDTRDRILTKDPLYLTIAGAGDDFDAGALDGAKVRLVFKPRAEAKVQHVKDRHDQVRDNFGFVVEERPTSKRQKLFQRLNADVTDLLRVDPEHMKGRLYLSEMTAGGRKWPDFQQAQAPAGVPLWAFRQTENLKQVQSFINWWIDHRQASYGDFGGGLSDDSDLLNQWPSAALLGLDVGKITASHDAAVEAIYRNGMVTNGLSTILTDELHAYEDGINADAQAMYLHWGEPRVMERLMETVRSLDEKITGVNAAGHRHIVSNYFSGSHVVKERPWQWSKPYSYFVFHPALLLGEFNGDPRSRKLIIDLADGYLAHGKQGADGVWEYPHEINFPDDAERGGGLYTGTGPVGPAQLFYAAWRWTGDDKYLRPILGRQKRQGVATLSEINANTLPLLGEPKDWSANLLTRAASPEASQSDLYVGWSLTGDKRMLERMFAREIQTSAQHMEMHTVDHWWSDRVEIFSDLLQRTRLGGMALRRNQTMPGHTVSWRFAAPAKATDVAILMPNATPTRFKVIAFNISGQPVQAALTGFDVLPGRWRMTSGTDLDGDDRPDAGAATTAFDFERGKSVDVTFPSMRATVLEFQLEAPAATPVHARPDLGVGRGDVALSRGAALVTVHSLGSQAAPAGTISVEDASGRVVATAATPAMEAPVDTRPRKAAVRVSLPRGFDPKGAIVRVALPGAEVTTLNNVAALQE
jgi:hypothetical protein